MTKLIRVEACGLLPPIENADEVLRQMRAAHRYRNTLVEIERARRAAVREAEVSAGLRAALDAVTAAQATVDALRERVAAAKSSTRKRAVSAELASELKAARVVLSDAKRAFGARRAAVRETVTEAAKAINDRAAELRRSARAECGAHWGTYLLIEAAADQAQKAPLWDGASPNDPAFVRWDGAAAIGVQLQGGIGAEDLDDDTQIRVVAPETSAEELARWERKRARLGDPTWRPAEGRDHAKRRTLWVRVGSTGAGNRIPVWAKFPMVLHRPLPPGARIKAVRVSVRPIGSREEWRALLTLELPAGHTAEPCGAGAVAVHLGWRQIRREKDGDDEVSLRVAVAIGGDGHREEMVLDPRTLAGLRIASGIESVRDKHFDRVRPLLAEALRDPAVAAALPERMQAEAKTMHAWRSVERLRAFVWRWEAAGAPGGDAPCDEAQLWRDHTPEPARARLVQGDTLRAAMLAWAHHDRHLHDYADNQRVSSQRHRRELYRIFAAGLARRYSTLVLDDTDRSELARVPKAEPGVEVMPDAVRSNRVLAAVYSLEDSLKNAFSARGGATVEVSSAHETTTCHACGVRTRFDRTDLSAACRACGAAWDQDDNAARNMLIAYAEKLAAERAAVPSPDGLDGPGAGGSASGSSRWAKAKAKVAARNAQRQPDA